MPQRNARIDLMRGICIVLVILDHLALRMPPQHGPLGRLLPGWLVEGLFSNGYEAVFVFFVISGFLIASNALTWWQRLDRIHLRTFYVRRFARIAPCLIVLVGVLSVLHLLDIGHFPIRDPSQSLPGAVGAAFGFYLNWYEGYTRHYLPGSWDILWSLSIEEMFYLGFPLVCLLLRREWLLAPALAVLAASLPVTRAAALAFGEIWQEKAYLPGMAAIATGILAALLASHVRMTRPLPLQILMACGAAGIAAVLFADVGMWHLLHQGVLLWVAVSAAVLLFAFDARARSGANTAPPGTRWLCGFGRLSYEIYLSHMFIVLGVVLAYRTTSGDPRYVIAWFVAALALSWALGWTIDKALSAPSNRLLRRLLV